MTDEIPSNKKYHANRCLIFRTILLCGNRRTTSPKFRFAYYVSFLSDHSTHTVTFRTQAKIFGYFIGARNIRVIIIKLPKAF